MYQEVVESHEHLAHRPSAPKPSRLSRIADLKLVYLFKDATRRLDEEVPAEDYTMWLESEHHVLTFQTGKCSWNPSAQTLKDAAQELRQFAAAIL